MPSLTTGSSAPTRSDVGLAAPLAGRLDALDGLRGIAVLAVLGYHAHLSWLRGGYLGVDVFFVLSGFLITAQLLKTRARRGMQSRSRAYGLFLAHRATRLVPALLVMLTAAWFLAEPLGFAARTATCTARAASYTMNLPFGAADKCAGQWHISWSLAAEVQYYSVIPIVLFLLLSWLRGRVRRPLRAAALVVGGVLGLAFVWHAVLWLRPGHKLHFLFAPDGRSMILLAGTAIALALADPWARRRLLRRVRSSAWPSRVAVLVLLIALSRGQAQDGFSAISSLVVVGIATGVLLLAALSGDAAAVPKLLTAALLTWVGRVSYSLYLWHEIGYAAAHKLGLPDLRLTALVGVALAVALAAASYRWVEQPALHALRRMLPGSSSRSAATAPSTARPATEAAAA